MKVVGVVLIVPLSKAIVVSVPPEASKVQVMAVPEPKVVVAAEYTSPLVPTPSPPAPREERKREEEIVEEAVEKKPFRPRTVVVELYPV